MQTVEALQRLNAARFREAGNNHPATHYRPAQLS